MSATADEMVLQRRLADRIRRRGPLPVEAYMRACLQDAEHGYYRQRAAIGAAGDFVTAPEISQSFGELLGIWSAVAWRAMGAPAAVSLVELGPGRGTLLCDALRAGRIVPGFLDALRLHLVESNRRLQAAQERTLRAGAPPPLLARLDWHPAMDEGLVAACAAAGAGTLLIANEFLDAMPVRQLVFHEGAWHERCVDIDGEGALRFVLGGRIEPAPGVLPASPPRDGEVFEMRPGLAAAAGLLGRLAERPLAALFIDYGHEGPAFGDSLQAVRRHGYAPPLEAPGAADLSAQVDFAAFAAECRREGLLVDGPVSQAEFLLGLGLAERTARLMSAAPPDQAVALEAAAARIADPLGMGGRFKVVGVRSRDVPVLPPFAQAGDRGRAR